MGAFAAIRRGRGRGTLFSRAATRGVVVLLDLRGEKIERQRIPPHAFILRAKQAREDELGARTGDHHRITGLKKGDGTVSGRVCATG